VEQNESSVCFGCINQRTRRPATYPHFFLGIFVLKCKKKKKQCKKGKNVVFFKKGWGVGLCGYKPL
jgi:hypothetical protein